MNRVACRIAILALMLMAISSLMPTIEAYTYIVPNAKSADKPGHCFDDQLKITVPVNKIRQRTGRCESMSCGSDYSLQVAGCGAVAAGPGFVITPTDYSKPYPECCPHPVMNSENLV
ncbi:AGAP010047-PA-like protein [Anopheles sinensis]|uniref:AGAP010047-PA-like protein n=1 Tax=Anopheles sinensis TaxID=74873 RepID=A0A084VFS1_ANOSI|nr:AGAP010047-PA-like protein [Anopheles sinensis]